ncbi:hypothetical protein QJS66_00095 [Kocuria rhizophila]|nr:hypothetical protein QJS66_00095 [Kocuria rhizophila]
MTLAGANRLARSRGSPRLRGPRGLHLHHAAERGPPGCSRNAAGYGLVTTRAATRTSWPRLETLRGLDAVRTWCPRPRGRRENSANRAAASSPGNR